MRDDFVNYLRPYNVLDSKVRLGSDNDGGYIVNETILNQADVLYTYGVEYNCDFEIDFHNRTSKPVHLYDHTVDFTPQNENLHFHKEGLSHISETDKKHFFEHLKENNDEDKKVLLKIDVEGAEYEFFENTDIEQLSKNVIGIVLEIHNTGDVNNYRPRATKILEKITNHFTLTHLHGNNSSPMIGSWWIAVPDTLELTFIRDDMFYAFHFDRGQWPTELDMPNNPELQDFPLVWIC